MALVVFIEAARTLRLILMTSKSPFAMVLIGFSFLFAATLLVTIWYGFLVTKLGMFFYYQLSLQSWIFAMKYVKSCLVATYEYSHKSHKIHKVCLWFIIIGYTAINLYSFSI